MPRFFSQNIETFKEITGEDAKHIALSLRMTEGEKITVCDTAGYDYFCEITSVHPEKTELKILSKERTVSEPDIKLTLYQCLTKGEKFETVIQKSVELGAYNIVPVLSERCISRPDNNSAEKKRIRWNKISESAAKQSGRGILPEVKEIIDFCEMCRHLKEYDAVYFFYEKGGQPIKTLISDRKPESVAVIVGPEGGFSEAEAEEISRHGGKTVTLGKRILRTETAPVAAITAIMLLTDNLE